MGAVSKILLFLVFFLWLIIRFCLNLFLKLYQHTLSTSRENKQADTCSHTFKDALFSTAGSAPMSNLLLPSRDTQESYLNATTFVRLAQHSG